MIDVLPTSGREVMAELLAGQPYLFALSTGDASWDARWGGSNPPAPSLDVTDILDLVGFVRPTVQGFVVPDVAGAIVDESGARFSVSATVTKFLRVRLSVPAGVFPNRLIREIGLFAKPQIAPSVPAGQMTIAAGDVVSRGKLFDIAWFRPQYLSPGTSIARNFIVRA